MTKNEQPIAVLAGTLSEFREYAGCHPQHRLVFCDCPERIRGIEFSRSVVVGTFEHRPDAAEIHQLVLPMVRPHQAKKPDYPAWVCLPCGHKWGRGTATGRLCTVHSGTCGICGQSRPVTEPRDFGHLKPGWEVDVLKKNKS